MSYKGNIAYTAKNRASLREKEKWMNNCNDCRYHLGGTECGIIGFTSKEMHFYYGNRYESPYIDEVVKLHTNGSMAKAMPLAISLTYSGLISDTTILNAQGKCKYYKRKWWKFWIR